MKKAELAEKAYKLGKDYEKTHRGCSQCVIAALQDALDIRNDEIFKAATGLAGGTGLAGDSGCESLYRGGPDFKLSRGEREKQFL